ncbi:MAG: hypothetical protein ACXQS5_05045 [Candidatus Methanospirareceae archaeon]
MADTQSPTSVPLVLAQDDILLKGNKRAKMVFIVESSLPADLKEAVESLIETGLSQVEMMGEILKIMAELLRRDGRFDDLAREIVRYREIVFKDERYIPFTMIEARAVMSTMRKWLNVIERRSTI